MLKRVYFDKKITILGSPSGRAGTAYAVTERAPNRICSFQIGFHASRSAKRIFSVLSSLRNAFSGILRRSRASRRNVPRRGDGRVRDRSRRHSDSMPAHRAQMPLPPRPPSRIRRRIPFFCAIIAQVLRGSKPTSPFLFPGSSPFSCGEDLGAERLLPGAHPPFSGQSRQPDSASGVFSYINEVFSIAFC